MILPLVVLLSSSVPIADDGTGAVKARAVAAVEAQAPRLIELSQAIWEFAEIALRESRSAAVLADYAEAEGFRVERGVAGMPTAFIASYGTGEPIIGIMGEFDALPGISQKALPRREALEEGRPGHGCGHNLFGPASLGAAVAIRRLIEAGTLSGTIRFYGTPAEESVGGKIYMVRDGLFDDVSVALAWHPSAEIRSDTEGTQALVDFIVEFRGRSAHAALRPVERRLRARRPRDLHLRVESDAGARATYGSHSLRHPERRRRPQRGAGLREGLVLDPRLAPPRGRSTARACEEHHSRRCARGRRDREADGPVGRL